MLRDNLLTHAPKSPTKLMHTSVHTLSSRPHLLLSRCPSTTPPTKAAPSVLSWYICKPSRTKNPHLKDAQNAYTRPIYSLEASPWPNPFIDPCAPFNYVRHYPLPASASGSGSLTLLNQRLRYGIRFRKSRLNRHLTLRNQLVNLRDELRHAERFRHHIILYTNH